VKTTIEDIAKIANVSKSTVSRVLNNTGSVSEITKNKVKKIIQELDYQPNQTARSLVTNKTNLVGIIVPDIKNPFYSKASWYSEKYFLEKDYITLILNTDNDSKMEKRSLEVLKNRNVDGIISIGGEKDLTNIINFNSKNTIPIVLLDRKVSGYDIPSVTVDNYFGGRIVTDYLFELGHKKIIFATSSYTQAEKERLNGFLESYHNKNIDLKNSIIFNLDEFKWKSTSEVKRITDFLNDKNPPTAIFASNDYKALQILKVLKKTNYKIPEQISLIGYDNIEFSSLVTPELSTVSQPIEKMISTGANMLCELMRRGKIEHKNSVSIKPELIKRESTRKV